MGRYVAVWASQGTTFGRCPLEPQEREWEGTRCLDGTAVKRRDEGSEGRWGREGAAGRTAYAAGLQGGARLPGWSRRRDKRRPVTRGNTQQGWEVVHGARLPRRRHKWDRFRLTGG